MAAVDQTMVVLVVTTPCSTAGSIRSFGPTYWIHLQDAN